MATSWEKVMRLAEDPAYRQLPEQISGQGQAEEPNCGDLLTISIAVNPRKMLTAAAYAINPAEACAPLYACAAAVVALAVNKPALAAYALTKEDIARLLSEDGSLDAEHVHCALMAEIAMKRAVVDYSQKLTQ